MKIYVSNLPYKITERQFYNLFAQFGEVRSYSLVMDKHTRKAKGYGFVEMQEDNAELAMEMVSEELVLGRRIFVTKSKHQDN